MKSPTPTPLSDAHGLPRHLRRPGSVVVQWSLTLIVVLFLSAFIIWPVVNVFRGAFSKGVDQYVKTFYVPTPADTSTLSRAEKRQLAKDQSQAERTREAVMMTVSVAAIVVPLNTIFGIAAAWAITKFKFRGKTLLISLIDLPFSVSPVVSGLIFVLLMGRVGIFGDWATHLNWPWPWSAYWRGFDVSWFPIGFAEWKQGVIFTPLATALASAFVTFPFVARSLIPLMASQGVEQEQAALTLGAKGRQMFFRVTLPAIKWGLIYGVILCTARAVGEFGAVSVVSGNTNANDTMPLRIEKIWQSYNTQQAFSLASLLATVSVATLLLKIFVDRKKAQQSLETSPGKTAQGAVK